MAVTVLVIVAAAVAVAVAFVQNPREARDQKRRTFSPKMVRRPNELQVASVVHSASAACAAYKIVKKR